MIQATRFWGNNSTSFAISKNNWWDFCQTVDSLKNSILPIFLHYFPISLHPYVPNPCISAPQASQSLIHQVSDSDEKECHTQAFQKQSLNPLFIRSQIQMQHPPDRENPALSLNPLFIRSQIQIAFLIWRMAQARKVSIPYSSGLRFRLKASLPILQEGNNTSLNPLFIRSQIQIFLRRILKRLPNKGLNPLFIRSQIQMSI